MHMLKFFYCLFLILLSLNTLATPANHSACAFILNNQFTQSGVAPSPFGISTAALPFEIDENGKTIIMNPTANFTSSENGRLETFTIRIPDYSKLAPAQHPRNGGRLVSGSQIPTKEVFIRIRRDSDGNLQEIETDANVSDAEMRAQVEGYRRYLETLSSAHPDQYEEWLRNFPPQIQAATINQETGRYDPGLLKRLPTPFYLFKGKVAEFDVANGYCRPSSLVTNYLINPDDPDAIFSEKSVDVNLCRDVYDFFQNPANADAHACYKTSLNRSLVDNVFKKYLDPNHRDHYEQLGLFDSQYENEMPLPPRFSNLPFNENMQTLLTTNINRLMNTSPVINAHNILHICYERGLREIIEDDALWAQPGGVSTSGAPAGTIQQ